MHWVPRDNLLRSSQLMKGSGDRIDDVINDLRFEIQIIGLSDRERFQKRFILD